MCAYALLRAGANVSARDIDGTSPLLAASLKGFTDVIEVLLSGGAIDDVNREDNERRTPLIAASAFADVKAVNLLLDAGADVNRADAEGRTALFAPTDLKIVRALLDRGADAKVLAKEGQTVLHTAAANGACAGVICALYRAGADPTVKVRGILTAADLARLEGHEDAATLLDLLAAKHRSMNKGVEGSRDAGAVINKVLMCVLLVAAVCVGVFLLRKDAM